MEVIVAVAVSRGRLRYLSFAVGGVPPKWVCGVTLALYSARICFCIASVKVPMVS